MSRNMTYQFDWGFVTIDTRTESEPEGYLAKFPVTVSERAMIDDPDTSVEVSDGRLLVIPSDEYTPSSLPTESQPGYIALGGNE